jgi:Carboxylesterase family
MSRPVSRTTWLIAAWVALSVHSAWGAGAQSPAERRTEFGIVVGTDDSATSGTYAWKGVPFAKPPVDVLRWKAPVDPEPWTAPRPTEQFGNACACNLAGSMGLAPTTATTQRSARP